jgi:large subunit ribosomal protein L25
MAETKLKATLRDGGGKGSARKLRAGGLVPGILYGHGMEPLKLALDGRELYHVLHTGAGSNVLVDLEVGEDRHLAMPREIQRDHVRGQFLHVDLLVVRRDEKITVDVPVHLVGESHGVKEGGVVEHHLWDLKLECLPTDVPEFIEADISALGIGDSLGVANVKIPAGATVLTPPEETIVSVVPPPILKIEEEVAEAVEGEEAVAEGEGATAEEAEAGETSAEAEAEGQGREGQGREGQGGEG